MRLTHIRPTRNWYQSPAARQAIDTALAADPRRSWDPSTAVRISRGRIGRAVAEEAR